MVIVGFWVRIARGEIYESEPKSLENVKKKSRKPSPGGKSRGQNKVKNEAIQGSGIGQKGNTWKVK